MTAQTYKENISGTSIGNDTLAGNGGSILAGATTLKVATTPSDTAGSDGLPATPPYDIAIGTERLRVTGVVAGTKTLTVTRGVYGTTAAAHNDGDVVDLVQTAAGFLAELALKSSIVTLPTQSYLGKNAIGGSSEVPVSFKQVMKQVTPGANGLLLSVGMYGIFGTAGGATPLVSVALLADNAGAPGVMLATNGSSNLFPNTTARWLHVPLVAYLTSGTPYWIAWTQSVSSAGLLVYYDGSGSDRTMTSTFIGSYDGAQYTITNSTKAYSLRADFLSPA